MTALKKIRFIYGATMGFKIVVMVKQVPDTHHISGEAMKSDGTVNRAALPAVFNPDDLHALEAALSIKDNHPDTIITVISMGPPGAIMVLKDALYRGADTGILVSDRRFAGADTLATSYVLKCVIEKIGKYDLVFCGRQAIDGDTAQVGPQTAEKLGINQITYVTEIIRIDETSIQARRGVDDGYEVVSSPLPVLMSFTNEGYFPRPASAKRMMAYKHADFSNIEQNYDQSYLNSERDSKHKKCDILLWNMDAVGADPQKCGLAGSPTKVKKVNSVVLKSADIKFIDNNDDAIHNLIQELINDHTIS